MKFLLDSNAVIALLRGDDGFLTRLKAHMPEDFGMPAIVAYELFYGAFKGRQRVGNLARIEALPFEVVEFDREDARQAGEIRAILADAGTPIGPYDILIAGQALARSLTLITHNTREFSRVFGLQVEDWE